MHNHFIINDNKITVQYPLHAVDLNYGMGQEITQQSTRMCTANLHKKY